MADVEIVVKLSEKDCEYLKRLGALWVESENGSSIVSKALLEGTILPKGHGRLIDESQITDTFTWDNGFIECFAPTIIEADTESEEV